MQFKKCKDCGCEKPWSDFYKATKNNRPIARCIPCHRVYANAHYERSKHRYAETRRTYSFMNKKAQNLRSLRYYESVEGRSRTLLHGVKRRSRQRGWHVGIDLEFIKSRIEAGYCEVTGIPFDLLQSTTTKKNSYSPSIDRIDATKPYTPDNSRIVIWQFNMMKAEMSDGELAMLCEIIAESLNK